MTDTSPLIATRGLDHVHLYVRDRPAAIAWYDRILGFRVFGQGHDDLPLEHPVFLGPAQATDHAVSIFVGDRPQGGDRTVAFHATGHQLAGFLAALPDPDVTAFDGTALTPKHLHDYGMAITISFCDPAGNHLELVTYETDAFRKERATG